MIPKSTASKPTNIKIRKMGVNFPSLIIENIAISPNTKKYCPKTDIASQGVALAVKIKETMIVDKISQGFTLSEIAGLK